MANPATPVIGRVDTHKRTHYAAAIVVEGTGNFGAALTRYLSGAGERELEVNKPNRQARYMEGKSDRLVAEQIARSVLAQTGTATPKTKPGPGGSHPNPPSSAFKVRFGPAHRHLTSRSTPWSAAPPRSEMIWSTSPSGPWSTDFLELVLIHGQDYSPKTITLEPSARSNERRKAQQVTGLPFVSRCRVGGRLLPRFHSPARAVGEARGDVIILRISARRPPSRSDLDRCRCRAGPSARTASQTQTVAS
jgi:hypothetical protein